MPPCYNWIRGFRVGTGSWPARQWCGTEKKGWDEVYSIDKSIVINASQKFDRAKRYLDSLK